MTLKHAVGQKLLNEVIRPLKQPSSWNVLIVDERSMRMLSACCKMHDILDERVTTVELITKKRQPLVNMNGIYLITPTRESIDLLIDDFRKQQQYKSVHIFFTEACPDDLFGLLGKSKMSKYLETCKEINVAFTPSEGQVYTVDAPDALSLYYNEQTPDGASLDLGNVAEQIATVCATLGEYTPILRYRSSFGRNANLLRLVESKLKKYLEDDKSIGRTVENSKSQLIILDRGFDAVTPLLHDLTLQALCRDLSYVDGKNQYQYWKAKRDGSQEQREISLDENDAVWMEHRHKHIADSSNDVRKQVRLFRAAHPDMDDVGSMSIKHMSKMTKQIPKFQQEMALLGAHVQLNEDVLAKCLAEAGVQSLCLAELDLITGEDKDGERIVDRIRVFSSLLVHPNVSLEDRIRLVLVYAIAQNGISDEGLDKLMQHANIPAEERETITNAGLLGINVIIDGTPKRIWTPARKSRANKYATSRWTPIIKDVIEDAIDDKLDRRQYPCLNETATQNYRAPTSARHGQRLNNRAQPLQYSGPRLIIFIVGGVTYSEMRVAYEVTQSKKPWEVIIGSDQILTPNEFVSNLRMMNKTREYRSETRDTLGTITVEAPTVPPDAVRTGCFSLCGLR